VLFVILCGWLSQAAPAAQPPHEATTLQQWIEAVRLHQPGRADTHAATVAVWTRADLQLALTTLQSLRDMLQRAFPKDGSLGTREDIRTRSGYRLSALEVQKMLGLTSDEARRGDINRLVKRGAMLHSDIAMLAQEGILVATEPESPAPTSSVRSVRVDDGRTRGPDPTDRHWLMARGLLENVTPDPAGDEWVHQWYRAAAARMRRDSLLGPGEPLLDRARQLFPKDPEFLFHAGCLHEALASPAIQSVLASATLPQNVQLTLLLSPRNWGQAARFFAGALAIQPAWPEARLRLGRVLGLLGRHKEAAVELRRALDETSDAMLVYWANLFLGDEEQALDDPAGARECYERALKCRPRAQAPHLALSQLARRQGDRQEAVAEVRAVMALPADGAARYDPLWDYFGSTSTIGDALFAELRGQLEKGGAASTGAMQ
jgi:tetratricopeptide (TPR) repeat protein